MIPQHNSELIKIIERIEDLESNDGRLLTELSIVNTKLDFIQSLLEDRPSRIEMKTHDELARKQIESLRVKAGEVVKISAAQSHFLKFGAAIVGGVSALEVWMKTRGIIFQFLGLK
jgi:hypothetical protein